MNALDSQGPVTAARFVGSSLLYAGSGSFVKCYEWRTSKLLRSVELFPVDKVHGIVTFAEDSKACVWGGRSLALLSGTHSPDFTVDKVFVCKDRVVDAGVLGSTLYVLTAHNEVLELDLSNVSELHVLKTHMCSERSILYSGALFLTPQRRYAGAGTVFGGVVVWDLDSDEIVRKFESHEGSIFDIAWSNDGEHIASCSDDRSIIISGLASGKCEAQGWGHASRIWKLRFAQDNCLVSAAEDCTARVWQFNTGKDLECVRLLTGHQGRSVWSIDVFRDEFVVATGGGDGKIMLWDLEGEASGTAEQWDVRNFGPRVRSCAIGSEDASIALTQVDGKVFYKPRAASSTWQLVVQNLGPVPVVKEMGTHFCAMASDGSTVLFAQATGHVVARFTLEERVQDFFVLDESRLLVAPTPPSTNLLVVDALTGQVLTRYNQHPGVGLVTAVAVVGNEDICIGSRNGALAAYTERKEDAVRVVPAALGTKTDAITSIKLVNSAATISTELSTKPSTEPSTNKQVALSGDAYLLVTARSSDYGYYTLPDMHRLFKNRARKRGSLEGSHLHKQGTIFWGFQKDTFVVWNSTIGFELAGINCGGMYRAWDCKVLATGLCFAYVRGGDFFVHHIKAPSTKFAQPLLQQGTHGREIRGIETCPTQSRLVAMGSEDTIVSLGWLNEGMSNITNACSVKNGHISGIQCIRWDPTGRFLYTGAGNGELVMWEVITRGEAVFVNEVGRMPTKNKDIQELRVMGVSAFQNLVAVAYSDSSFRVWRLRKSADASQTKYTWELSLEAKYRECCLLNIDLLQLRRELWLAITSTDGHLVVYNLTESENGTLSEQCRLRKPIHQSSVRSSCISTHSDGFIHYSGGDDNAFCAVNISFGSADDLVAKDMFSVPNAHSSAITAVALKSEYNEVLTTGSDQKVNMWRATDGLFLAGTRTDVSDTGCMVVHDTHVITAGIGVQFFEMSLAR